MPIRPENRARYPKDWALRVRFVREIRARNRCEWCGLQHHAVGYRDQDGRFVRAGGNGPLDFAGIGQVWPSGELLSFADAAEVVQVLNDHERGDRACDADGHRWFVVRLTVAHVYDERPEAASLLNLAALCERCHNRHDRHGRQERRRARLGQPPLVSRRDRERQRFGALLELCERRGEYRPSAKQRRLNAIYRRDRPRVEATA